MSWRCWETGKVEYTTLKAAIQATVRAWRETGHRDILPYLCGDHWHIGHRTRRRDREKAK